MRRSVWIVPLLALATACSLIAQLDDLEVDPCYDGRCQDPEPRDAAVDTGIPRQDGGRGDVVDGGFTCPGSGGPPGIPIPGTTSCVDRTEVTVSQYQAFVAAKGGNTSGQIPACAGNTSFAAVDAGSGDFPVTGVDWCDAHAFCAWAGKRLCGRVPNGGDAGGPLDENTVDNVVQNQWLNACTSSGINAFVYGPTYISGYCNDFDAGNALKPVGSFPKCQNAAGHVDMNGNVFEFVDHCVPSGVDAGPATDNCFIFGGAFGSGDTLPASDYRCSIKFSVSRTYRHVDVGFRCCTP